MSNTIKFISLTIIILSIAWLIYELSLRRSVQWHFMTAGGINFIISIIVNRQFTKRDYNYLGILHVVFAVVFFGYGYFFL